MNWRKSRVTKITFREFIWLFTSLQRHHLDLGEPIPDLGKEDKEMIKHCLNTPFGGLGKIEYYPTFEKKVAIMFYLFCKRHGAVNGNKRIAVEITNWFVFVNGKLLNISNDDFIKLAKDVVKSEASVQNQTVKLLALNFKNALQPFPLNRRFRLFFIIILMRFIMKMIPLSYSTKNSN